MKKLSLSILTMAVAATATWAQPLDRSVRPQAGPAPVIKLGKTESFTLPNGLKVFVVENHKLPTISCDIQLDIKPELQGDMAGYKEMMSELLLSGTRTRSKDELNKQIDYIGADINVSDDEIEGKGLKKYADKILDLMADIAMNTEMNQEELDKVKKRTISELETEKNSPDAMVKNVASVVNFGKNHPFGEIPTEQTIKNITLERCESYYRTYFHPNVAYMAIVGDVTMDEIKPLVEKYFGPWTKTNVPVTKYSMPETNGQNVTRVAFAPRTGAVQSVVDVTYPIELKPGDPDVIKSRVANAILGGGSQGRLFLDLREKHAWTYGAYSVIRDNELGGSFHAEVKCRNVVSDSAVGAILNEMGRMSTDPVPDSSLKNAINYLSGSFAIALEDPRQVAQFAINIERYHMPADYYENYLQNLSKVTAQDIVAVSQKYIHPSDANIVVAGSKDEVAETLKKYATSGKIDYYNVYGQEIQPQKKKAAPANMTADDVIKKYIQAIGGADVINAIHDIRVVSSSQTHNVPLTITETKKSPDKIKVTIEGTINGQKMTLQQQVCNGTTGYMEAQGQKQPLQGDDLEELKQEGDIQADLHPEKYGITRKLNGIESVNGSDAYEVVATDAKGNKTTEYYDVKTGYLVKQVQVHKTAQGDVTASSEYSDYREVPNSKGYKMYYTEKESSSANPEGLSATTTDVEINTGVPDKEFE